ncbi:hypothetical protein TSOC_012767 [Tetrabaena socialis]|uniref:Ankyrin repeat domain-containing protein n=1 Tax=Tetrabaena socialis TaxID=47790 RepID=A0A2J7ZM59_9CHLO|nr:hypothetical protein TSOC_012767 [Tetrabaena socialis]|eukprot:PNH01359.1 hypothetical protein TSOC_012767 [Tetrabaena socialis]
MYMYWFPDLLDGIAGHLTGNEVVFLRLVDKATATHFSTRRTVHLSQPVPPREFEWFISSRRSKLNKEQQYDVAKLTARSGSVENLGNLLARSEADWRFGVWDAAGGAGRLNVCSYLLEPGNHMFDYAAACAAARGLTSAARAGQPIAICDWVARATRATRARVWEAAICAAEGGHVRLMDHFLDQVPDPAEIIDYRRRELIFAAARGCDLGTLSRLCAVHHSELPQCDLIAAASRSLLDFQGKVVWLEAQGCGKSRWACVEAMRMPDAVQRVQWLRERGYLVYRELLQTAAYTSNLERVQYVLSLFPGPDDYWNPWNRIRKDTSVAILEAIHAHGFRWDISSAAEVGNVPAMAWLLEKLGPGALTADVTLAAARGGSMEAVVWLHDRGCPWHSCTFHIAAIEGSEELVEFLAARGCPMDVDAYASAAVRGNTAMLGCLQRVGCPWTSWSFWRAVNHSYMYSWDCGESQRGVQWMQEHLVDFVM